MKISRRLSTLVQYSYTLYTNPTEPRLHGPVSQFLYKRIRLNKNPVSKTTNMRTSSFFSTLATASHLHFRCLFLNFLIKQARALLLRQSITNSSSLMHC